MSISDKSLKFHEKHRGKLSVRSKVPLKDRENLSLAYTPGVAAPCEEIANDPEGLYKYTMKGNTVAVVTDGSAVLGLGNIGAAASLPVMEGKCALFQEFAGINAFPLCINTQDIDEFVETVQRVVVPFGGINLEDIGAPQCFEIEKRLKEVLDVPVFHDDQHGTSTVVLAGMINALKVTGRTFASAKIVISGAGAAGSAIAKLFLLYGAMNVILCDRHGAISLNRKDLPPHKRELAKQTNPSHEEGSLVEVLKGADAFVGVSGPNIIGKEAIQGMAKNPIVFALANPVPEIMPDEAREGGATVISTGRSDFPNQVNNVLAFPGIFRGLLDARLKDIHLGTFVCAARALAAHVKNPTPDKIIPDIFDEGVVETVANAVKMCEL